ncbi:hypothetical protein [Ascidiimonas sp. W6]|uniref:hypothetical protein n=1 Tax=Ascidiimonas meishanensis TaxID=3128903 RepID=UPI0030ED4875
MTIENSDLIYLPHQLHNFSFGKVYFFEHMMISEFKEGIVFTYKNALEFISQAENYYGTERKLVYISNRIYSYSVDPVDWIKLGSSYNNLMAIGVINYTSFKKKVFFVEKLFCRKPMMSFDYLKEAVDWAYELTQVHESKAG